MNAKTKDPNNSCLKDPYLFTDKNSFFAGTLECPVCGTGYHPSLAAIVPDNDEYDGGGYGWHGRGEVIVINLVCESGGINENEEYEHCAGTARLMIGNHKGSCDIAVLPGSSHDAYVEYRKEIGFNVTAKPICV